MQKRYVLPAIALVMTGIVFFGTAQTFAQSSSEQSPTIVQQLAQKFGLKEADVQAVFDAARAERQAQMHARLEERLTQAVQDGKLTEAQKQAILTKHKELQAKKESMKDKTPEERRQYMQQHRQELKTWAEEQGIDMQYLFGGMGKGMMRGEWHMR